MSFLLFLPVMWWAGVRDLASTLPIFIGSSLAAAIAILLPLTLELLGLIAPSYQFTERGMLIRPQTIELRELPTIAILALSGLAGIVTGSLTIGRVRDALVEAEERMYTYTWQIQQLLPDAAQTSERVIE